MAFKIESQVANGIVIRTFLTSYTQDKLVPQKIYLSTCILYLKIHAHTKWALYMVKNVINAHIKQSY
jgi:hypothetical protein